MSYPFFGGHMLGCFVCWAFFCVGTFSSIVIFCEGFAVYIFFSLRDDIDIIGPTSSIHLAFDHFFFKLVFMGLLI